MKRMRIIPCLFLFIIVTLVHHSADASCGTRYGEFIWDGSTEKSIPTNITEFKNNMNIVLDDLPTNQTKISLYRWVGVYSGVNPNAAYAQGRCIGYVDNQTCQDCITNITAMLRLGCSTEEKSALLYHNQSRCMVQYSNHDMIGLVQMPDNLVLLNNHSNKVDPPSSIDAFYVARNNLFHALALRTEGRPDGYQLFAAGKWYEGSSNNTIYGVAQCSPDLESTQCASCLVIVGQKLENYFYGKVGGSIVGPSCNYRYDVKSFMDESGFVFSNLSPPAQLTPPAPPALTPPPSPAQLTPPSPPAQLKPPSPPTPVATASQVNLSAASSCGKRTNEYIWVDSTESSIPTNLREFRENLDHVLDSLANDIAKISLYKWNSVYSGVDPNAAYAQGRCIGYVDNNNCQNCIKDATAFLKSDCAKENNSALLYQDKCVVQYSNHGMLGLVQMPKNLVLYNNNSAKKLDHPSSVNAFNAARNELLNTLASRAKDHPDGYQMFATGNWYERSSKNTIYGVAQCSPDLTKENCTTCFETIHDLLQNYFNGIVGGAVVGPSCNYRYEIFNFFNGTSEKNTGAKANKTKLVIYILPPLVVISIIIFVGFIMKKKNMKKSTQEVEIVGKLSDEEESIFEPGIETEETLKYEFDTVRAATDNFSEAKLLGQGGFGAVYKGRFENGEEIAVKRLSETSGQGEVEFKNEVTLLAKLQHRNLVRLLGFCLKKKERLLIYEFVANSSLDNYIFDPIKRASLTWDQLYKIIIGLARGLLYLHEDSRLRIIHRDLKSSNVLLDSEMTPKIADFGTARLFVTGETQGTNKIIGTYGYMAPEYAMHGLFSVKSDVFSFGVLLLEIICGRKNTFFRIENNVEDLLSYAWKNWQEGTIINLLDSALRSEISSTREITRCIHIGLLCAQEDETQRPTMGSVFNLLNNLSIALPLPLKPAFFQQLNINQGTPLLQDYDSGHNSNSSGSKNKSSMSW